MISVILISIAAFTIFPFLLGKSLSQDISLEPILTSVSPDFKAEHFFSRPSVYLISYADGHEVFFKNQNALASSALNKGIDFIFNYRRSHLDQDFVKQHATLFEQKTGAGYWLWKPWIILNTLSKMPENDILIYADTGILFRKPIIPLIELAKQQDIVLFEYDPDKYWGKPINITKREVFIALDCDTKECHEGRHVWAGFMVLKNTQKTRDFIQSWLAFCCDEKLINDDLDPIVHQYPNFDRPYHDESILNTLYNKDPKGKYLFQSKTLFENYVTWHHRHINSEDASLLMAYHHHQRSLIYMLESELLNNYLTLFLWRFCYCQRNSSCMHHGPSP